MRSGLWKADWCLGLAVVVRKAYDLALSSASPRPSDKLAIIQIDQQSIDNIGRSP